MSTPYRYNPPYHPARRGSEDNSRRGFGLAEDGQRRASADPRSPSDDRTPRKPSTVNPGHPPPRSPHVRFPNEPDERADRDHSRSQSQSRGREQVSAAISPPSSRDSSPSRSPHRHRRRSSSQPPSPREEKPWYKKKTVWTGVATLATVVALVPTSMSAQASLDAANASHRSARASERSAKAVEKSADASIRAADASLRSATAVSNTGIARGHQDAFGRYTGPIAEYDRGKSGSDGGGDGRRHIEYGAGHFRAGGGGKRRY